MTLQGDKDTTPLAEIPVVEGLFRRTERGPRLLGASCDACGCTFFPVARRCSNPACTNDSVRERELGPEGVLYSYTIQHYPPPPPFRFEPPFEPYAIGLVELPQGVRVVGMLKIEDLKQMRIGMPLQLVLDRLVTDQAGVDVMTWKFEAARQNVQEEQS